MNSGREAILKFFGLAARLFCKLAVIYAVLFSVISTVALLKAYNYGSDFYESVESLKDDLPKMSKFMEALRDSNPNVIIKHTFVPLDSISPSLRQAVIFGEDPGFYYHPGFDVRAIVRAAEVNQAAGKTVSGGSTITQQLAKNMFLSGERSYVRKAKELGYALLMERLLGKDRILELYLNYAQWGKDIFGCEAASEAYFHKKCSQLDRKEAVDLAVMLPSPCKNRAEARNSEAEQKRRIVINGLFERAYPTLDDLPPVTQSGTDSVSQTAP